MAQINTAGYIAKQGFDAMRRSRTLEWLTRVGFASKGVVYFMVGALALMAAFHKGGETTDRKGVMERIAAQPFGEFALIVIGIGLFAYAAWRFLCCFMDVENEGSDARGAGKRLMNFLSGFIYASAGMYAFKVVTNSARSGGDGAQTWTARLLDAPAGPWLVALAGAGIILAGFMQIRKGWKESFRKHLQLGKMTGDHRHWAVRAGKWGHIARGTVFAVIGLFVVLAGVKHDPGQARGSEGALDTLAVQPFGQWILAFVAAGLACYGLYSFVEAKYRRVSLR
jgi:Domain of Unknown Function (DUF1206)